MVSCIHSQRSSVTLLWYTKKRFKLDPTQSSHSLGLDISKRRCLHIIYYILRIVGCGSWSLAHYAQGFIRSVELLQDFPQFDDGALWSLCFCCRTAGVRVAVLDPHTPDRDKDFAGFSLQISGKSLKATKRSFKAPKSHRIPLGLAEWDSWTYSRVILPEIFGKPPQTPKPAISSSLIWNRQKIIWASKPWYPSPKSLGNGWSSPIFYGNLKLPQEMSQASCTCQHPLQPARSISGAKSAESGPRNTGHRFFIFFHMFPIDMANLKYPAKNWILSWLVDNPIDTANRTATHAEHENPRPYWRSNRWTERWTIQT